MNKYTESDVYNHIYCKIFNNDVYELFPELEEFIKEDYFVVTGFLDDFLIDLFDLSKPVISPFVDERATFVYRALYGINNYGLGLSKVDIGKQLSLTSTRVGQLIKASDLALINMIISRYKLYKKNLDDSDVLVEDLGLSRGVYNKLKRHGIKTVSEIDLNHLKEVNGFGEKTCSAIEKGIYRIKK